MAAVDAFLVVEQGAVRVLTPEGELLPLFDDRELLPAFGVDECAESGALALSSPPEGAIQLVGPQGVVVLDGLAEPRQVVCRGDAIAYAGQDGLHLVEAEWLANPTAAMEGGATFTDTLVVPELPADGTFVWTAPDRPLVQLRSTMQASLVTLPSGDVEQLEFESPAPSAVVNPLGALLCFGATGGEGGEGGVLCGEAGFSTVAFLDSALLVTDFDGEVVHQVELAGAATGITPLGEAMYLELTQSTTWSSATATVTPESAELEEAPPTTEAVVAPVVREQVVDVPAARSGQPRTLLLLGGIGLLLALAAVVWWLRERWFPRRAVLAASAARDQSGRGLAGPEAIGGSRQPGGQRGRVSATADPNVAGSMATGAAEAPSGAGAAGPLGPTRGVADELPWLVPERRPRSRPGGVRRATE